MGMSHLGSPLRLGNYFGDNGYQKLPGAEVSPIYVYDVVPAQLAADAIALAQAVGAAGNLTLSGALASGSPAVATLDIPRNVTVTSDNGGDTTQTAIVTGKDVYGFTMTELIAFNGAATIAGKKAFKTVSQIAISALMAGSVSAGVGDVLGMPYAFTSLNYIVKVAWAGVLAADASTVVAADATTATNATGDVRGTVDPSSATNGSRRLTVSMYLANLNTKVGLYGVPQA